MSTCSNTSILSGTLKTSVQSMQPAFEILTDNIPNAAYTQFIPSRLQFSTRGISIFISYLSG